MGEENSKLMEAKLRALEKVGSELGLDRPYPLAIESQQMLNEAYQHGDTMRIDIWYPRSESRSVKAIQIGLIDMRAAEDIRVSYDFDRNGWRIEKATVFEWDAADKDCDPCWKEVSFVSGDSP